MWAAAPSAKEGWAGDETLCKSYTPLQAQQAAGLSLFPISLAFHLLRPDPVSGGDFPGLSIEPSERPKKKLA